MTSRTKISWPEGKKFAFTIFDDTDNAVLENVKAVYDFLHHLKIYTTKSVWVLEPEGTPRIGGLTCGDVAYREYCQELKKRGFEISLHNVSSSSSNRQRVTEGLEAFKNYFGEFPKSFANHSDNTENLYWGEERLSGLRRSIYKKISHRSVFKGHNPESDYFWGDLAKEHLEYVRNFVFEDINTFKSDPKTPYHDPDKPFVNKWFSSSNAENINVFKRNITKKAIDQLADEGGYSILYTHFCTFADNGKIDPYFKEIMEYIAEKDGWYVPVNTLLDYVNQSIGDITLRKDAKSNLEWKWLSETIKTRLTKGR
ncbi:MAG: hypothetical protein GC181_03635 [Bacteroidetes bacterium]|nr:hypothetical protein [Bacteroidota bacterium]